MCRRNIKRHQSAHHKQSKFVYVSSTISQRSPSLKRTPPVFHYAPLRGSDSYVDKNIFHDLEMGSSNVICNILTSKAQRTTPLYSVFVFLFLEALEITLYSLVAKPLLFNPHDISSDIFVNTNSWHR